ncbi:hypothetical protein LCGC14_2434230, partial [marine sediment metagenome]
GIPASGTEPLTTTKNENFEEIPLTLPSNTARGRLLANWQAEWQEAGYAPKVADRNAALGFDKQMVELESLYREELTDQGFSDDDVDANINNYMEMQLRSIELHEQGIREWKHQNNTTELPDDNTMQEISGQIQEALNEEFKPFVDLFLTPPESLLDKARNTFSGIPVLEGIPKMAIGVLEVIDALARPLSPNFQSQLEPLRGEREQRRRSSSPNIGGLPLLGTNLDDALPDLFQGMDDFFGGGVKISKPLVKPALQKGLAPLAEDIIAPGEEIAELFGVDARGKVSIPVRNAIASDLAVDITAEIVNPAAMLIVLPFVGYGLRAGMGVRAASVQIASNLLFTGMEPKLIPAFARWTSLAAKIGPRAALSKAPRAIRGTKLFELVMENLRAEGGGIRLGKSGLTEGGDRMLLLAEQGKKISRKELLKQARANGIGPGNRLQRMSSANILEELAGKKAMIRRIGEQAKLIQARPSLGARGRRFVEETLADPKASLDRLRNAAKRAGVDVQSLLKRPAQLTTQET